jgi:hypothetical protein
MSGLPGRTMIERPAEPAYYVAQRLEQVLEWYELNPNMADVGDMLVARAKAAIDLLRWYDWEEEQRRRQSLKGPSGT